MRLDLARLVPHFLGTLEKLGFVSANALAPGQLGRRYGAPGALADVVLGQPRTVSDLPFTQTEMSPTPELRGLERYSSRMQELIRRVVGGLGSLPPVSFGTSLAPQVGGSSAGPVAQAAPYAGEIQLAPKLLSNMEGLVGGLSTVPTLTPSLTPARRAGLQSLADAATRGRLASILGHEREHFRQFAEDPLSQPIEGRPDTMGVLSALRELGPRQAQQLVTHPLIGLERGKPGVVGTEWYLGRDRAQNVLDLMQHRLNRGATYGDIESSITGSWPWWSRRLDQPVAREAPIEPGQAPLPTQMPIGPAQRRVAGDTSLVRMRESPEGAPAAGEPPLRDEWDALAPEDLETGTRVLHELTRDPEAGRRLARPPAGSEPLLRGRTLPAGPGQFVQGSPSSIGMTESPEGAPVQEQGLESGPLLRGRTLPVPVATTGAGGFFSNLAGRLRAQGAEG